MSQGRASTQTCRDAASGGKYLIHMVMRRCVARPIEPSGSTKLTEMVTCLPDCPWSTRQGAGTMGV